MSSMYYPLTMECTNGYRVFVDTHTSANALRTLFELHQLDELLVTYPTVTRYPPYVRFTAIM